MDSMNESALAAALDLIELEHDTACAVSHIDPRDMERADRIVASGDEATAADLRWLAGFISDRQAMLTLANTRADASAVHVWSRIAAHVSDNKVAARALWLASLAAKTNTARLMVVTLAYALDADPLYLQDRAAILDGQWSMMADMHDEYRQDLRRAVLS